MEQAATGESKFGGIPVDASVQTPAQIPAIPVGESGLAAQFETGRFTPEVSAKLAEAERESLAAQPMGTAALGMQEIGKSEKFDDDMAWKSVISHAVSSTPKSAVQFIGDMITPLLHPVQTTQALWKLGEGIGEKMIPGEQENEQMVDDLVQVFKDRYGGIENFKQTLANDPVGVAADISGVLVPAGTTVKGAATAGKASRLAKIAEGASRLGKAVDPLAATTKATKAIATKLIPEELPSELYQSAAKFSTTIPEADRALLAKTALDNNIMPTAKGLEKTRAKINDFNDQITKKIDAATDAGERIPVRSLFEDFRTLKRQISGEPITRKRQIERVAKELGTHFKQLGKKDLTPAEAQALKQAIYEETENFYSKVKNSPARIEAKQAVARSAKQNLEKLFPEIKNLNKQEGALIELRKQLEKSASRISNRDLLGIGVPIKGGAGGAVAGTPGMAFGAAIGLLDTPQVKAKLAIVANRLKKKGVVLSEDSLMRQIIEGAPPTASLRPAGVIERTTEEQQ